MPKLMILAVLVTLTAHCKSRDFNNSLTASEARTDTKPATDLGDIQNNANVAKSLLPGLFKLDLAHSSPPTEKKPTLERGHNITLVGKVTEVVEAGKQNKVGGRCVLSLNFSDRVDNKDSPWFRIKMSYSAPSQNSRCDSESIGSATVDSLFGRLDAANSFVGEHTLEVGTKAVIDSNYFADGKLATRRFVLTTVPQSQKSRVESIQKVVLETTGNHINEKCSARVVCEF